MAKKIDITGLNIPKHVAIILDGNGSMFSGCLFCIVARKKIGVVYEKN